MRKHSLLSRNSGTYTSPSTPDYLDNSTPGEIHKGWSSERVPLPSNSRQRHISAVALMPFTSGRTLPSKWDDAERWITSPISGLNFNSSLLAQPQRQTKSKSGPIGAQGLGCFSNYSQAMPVIQGGSARDFVVGSPFTTGVLVPNVIQIHYGGGHSRAKSNPFHIENAIEQASGLPGWSDFLPESSFSCSQDDKFDGTKDLETMVSHAVSLRDMATQMSPRDSMCSSPKGRSSFSASPPPVLPTVERQSNHPSKPEIRDVEVDKRATMTRQFKKNRVRKTPNSSLDIGDLQSSWNVSEAANSTSKLQRHEAKIIAWENLQKAKAEAAIRKLEMKLEKKRSASMDKILSKLRLSQIKAQEMRNSMSDNTSPPPLPEPAYQISSFNKYVKMGFLGRCFTSQVS
ncbi:hypothetical protein NMG60_11026056 [Bertholletia excelsa]